MRYGVFSDVHSNLEALEVVLKALNEARVDRLLCAGDLVGYGADPGPCLVRLRGSGMEPVAGNHDWAVAGRMPLSWFNENARAGLVWTMGRLGAAERAQLGELPLSWSDGAVSMAHSTLHEPEEFHYAQDLATAAESLRVQETPVAFIGHTHVPGFFLLGGGRVTYESGEALTLRPGQRVLVNVGSVGQPRDGDPRAACCLYDSDSGRIEIRRLAYPVERAQEKVRRAGLPEFLARRLEMGY